MIESSRVGELAVEVHESRAALGAAAGAAAAAAIAEAQRARPGPARVVFAAAPSQDETLAALAAAPGVDWSRVVALHMDEYLGLPPGAPQRFATYLRRHLFDLVRPGAVHVLDGDGGVEAEIARYAALLAAAPIDVCLLGIGENGHLAFNDPPVADFADPALVKPVELDGACRVQQVHDGCFARLEDVPRRALTLTVPALMGAARLVCSVPGRSKRDAVGAALRGPVSTACPASALRRHPRAALYLDPDSWPGAPR